jgi:hypothetical protein
VFWFTSFSSSSSCGWSRTIAQSPPGIIIPTCWRVSAS